MACGGDSNNYFVPDFDLGTKHSFFFYDYSNLLRLYSPHVLDRVKSLRETG